MYEICIQARFSATHQVRVYDGEFEPLHGHDWAVKAVFRGPELDRIGVLVDFVAAEQALRAVVAALDHTYLNEVPLLRGLNPTAEHVARRVFEELAARMGAQTPLFAVYVREAPGCTAGYAIS
jgi:6-pyruvoyltetrahydropterin/6-carboxytetrahydropterin synthase